MEQQVKILLAEDNIINQKVLRAYADMKGWKISIADNGLQAVQLLSQSDNHDYNIVLMDVHMPEMDGLKATRTIREDPRFADLPIIALTAQSDDSEIAEIYSAGVTGYLRKPVDFKNLENTILEIIEQHKQA